MMAMQMCLQNNLSSILEVDVDMQVLSPLELRSLEIPYQNLNLGKLIGSFEGHLEGPCLANSGDHSCDW